MQSIQSEAKTMSQSISHSTVQRLAVVAVTALVAAGCSGPMNVPGQAPGESASTGITVQAVERSGYDQVIAAHRGEVVLVDFWATWCLGCTRQFPHTVQLSEKYADRGLAVVSVSLNAADENDQVLAFLQSQNATFDNLLSAYDNIGEAMTAFEIENGTIPHYKLYDRQGRLHHTFASDPSAPFTPEDIEREVLALLAEK
jgi:thiol-disulfide isomerase/thioredoxin